ncbi:MAG TPA: NifU N-terminal domain-containing protein [Acidimicrobiales bacterium]|nr:NifU N-terminal domain-containing protein [Acidimicrobiales bacterium]
MANATPQPSPNPNALRFQLDTTLATTLSFSNATAAEADPFAKQVFSAEGVASIFGVNDFVTVTRSAGADWDPIIAVVQSAAAEHL